MVRGRGDFRAGGYLLKKTTCTRQNLENIKLTCSQLCCTFLKKL